MSAKVIICNTKPKVRIVRLKLMFLTLALLVNLAFAFSPLMSTAETLHSGPENLKKSGPKKLVKSNNQFHEKKI